MSKVIVCLSFSVKLQEGFIDWSSTAHHLLVCSSILWVISHPPDRIMIGL